MNMWSKPFTMSLQKTLLLLFMLTMFCISAAEEFEDCFSSNVEHYKCHLDTRTPYRFIVNRNDSELNYPGCTASKIWMFVRHGTRYPGKKWTSKLIKKLPKIRDSILKSNSQGDGTLTDREVELLRNWQIPFTKKDVMNLASEGERELVGIAERFQSRFPLLMPEIYNNQTYMFKYTATQRAEESAKHFALGLFGRKQAKDVRYPTAEKKDPILRFYKCCDRWREEIDRHPDSYKEQETFLNSTIIAKMLNEVSERVGFEIDYDKVHLIQTMCAFETAWNNNEDLPWCNLLSLEHFKIFEFVHDLQYYWIDGYGYSLTYEQACTATKDMFDFFQSEDETKVRAYFTHSGTLLKLLGLLGVAKDETPLRHDSFSSAGNRLWRTSRIDAFASNIAFVLYDCETQGPSILLLHQERVVQLPGCPADMPCPLSTMKDKYPDTEDECQFSKMCAIKS